MTEYYNFNETQHTIPQLVRDALIEGARCAEYYVDPPHFDDVATLTNLISKRHNVGIDNVILSNGSNDVMHSTFNWLAQCGYQQTVLFTPNYESAFRYSKANSINICPVKLNYKTEFEPNVQKIIDTVEQSKYRKIIVYFSNPNNPIGVFNTKQQIRYCIEQCEKIPGKQLFWIIDEAYIEFAKLPVVDSFVDVCTNVSNMIVLRTFSKYYQLSGARVGFGITTASNVNNINDHISTDCMNIIGVKAAIATFDCQEYYQTLYQDVQLSRTLLYQALKLMNIPTCQSYGNFLFCRLTDEQHKRLQQNDIIISRSFDCPFDDHKWNRITVGTIQNVYKVIEALV